MTQNSASIAAFELKYCPTVGHRTASRIGYQIIMEIAEREVMSNLGRSVLVNNAYLGGERNGGDAVCGSQIKSSFVTASELCGRGGLRQAVIKFVSRLTLEASVSWACAYLRPDAAVLHDCPTVIRAVIGAGSMHSVIVSSGGGNAAQAGGVRCNVIAPINIEQTRGGNYQPSGLYIYAHRYLTEAVWRFNRRFFDL